MIRQRATQQHIDYLRQLDPPRPYRSVEVESQLRSIPAEIRTVFGHPEVTRQPTETELAEDRRLRSLELPQTAPRYRGLLRKLEMDPFGTIQVIHGDLFEFSDADCLILPMSANLLPYRGLGLEAFERGGRTLVSQTFQQVKGASSKASKLEVGDTILVPGHGTNAKQIMFCIMPWFWQGSPMDAGKRLRYCVKKAFLKATEQGIAIKHIALPNIGGGLYGFEPKNSSLMMLEEAVEALLQIEASTPNYELQTLSFVDISSEVAESFEAALVEVSHRWLPEKRLITAPEWWGVQSRRLIVCPDAPNFFLKRFKIKFKQRHGVKKLVRRNYIGNIKPWLWRAHKVQQPPPLLVYKKSGEVADQEQQLKARPYYFRGVSHWLFPSRRSGFPVMRRGAHGQWVGVLRPNKLGEQTRPRL